jgi:hypothetical protein
VSASEIIPVVCANVDKETKVATDEALSEVHTNTVEG